MQPNPSRPANQTSLSAIFSHYFVKILWRWSCSCPRWLLYHVKINGAPSPPISAIPWWSSIRRWWSTGFQIDSLRIFKGREGLWVSCVYYPSVFDLHPVDVRNGGVVPLMSDFYLHVLLCCALRFPGLYSADDDCDPQDNPHDDEEDDKPPFHGWLGGVVVLLSGGE